MNLSSHTFWYPQLTNVLHVCIGTERESLLTELFTFYRYLLSAVHDPLSQSLEFLKVLKGGKWQSILTETVVVRIVKQQKRVRVCINFNTTSLMVLQEPFRTLSHSLCGKLSNFVNYPTFQNRIVEELSIQGG